MILPNFIIAGAPKCGTSALWKNLNEHPEIFLSILKEPTFFTRYENKIDDNIIRPGPNRIPTYNRGLDWYKSNFKSEATTKMIGEASTIYMSMPDSPELIFNHVPNIKLIFILRDPAKRLYSHYWQDYKEGIRLKKIEIMANSQDPGYNYYKYVSHYKRHLDRYYKVFNADQIRLILLDDLKNDPDQTYKQIFNFLGVDDQFVPSNSVKKVNPHSVQRIKILGNLLWDLRGLRLTQKLPSVIRTRLGRLAKKISQMNSISAEYPKLSNEFYMQLSKEFEEDINFLEKHLGRDLSYWRA